MDPGKLLSELNNETGATHFISVESVTDGQATTAYTGISALNELGFEDGWITVGACDFASLYDDEKLRILMSDDSADLIVWGCVGYPGAIARPNQYGWVQADACGNVERVSVKQPLADPATDPVVLGAFSFKGKDVFTRCYSSASKANDTVNGEYYVDSLVNHALHKGYRVKLFLVDTYLCWGTPSDLKTFEYWQSCFHKWEAHEYTVTSDCLIEDAEADLISKKIEAEAISFNAENW